MWAEDMVQGAKQTEDYIKDALSNIYLWVGTRTHRDLSVRRDFHITAFRAAKPVLQAARSFCLKNAFDQETFLGFVESNLNMNMAGALLTAYPPGRRGPGRGSPPRKRKADNGELHLTFLCSVVSVS